LTQTCHIVNLILVSVRWQSSTGIGGRFHRNTHTCKHWVNWLFFFFGLGVFFLGI